MNITEQPIEMSQLIISPEQLLPRTPGVHVSGIINYLATELGRRENTFSRTDLDLFAMLGRVFEVVLAQSMFKPPRYERLGELEVDGIIGSPDAFDTEEMAIVEMKCTWKSSKRDIFSFREYIWQVGAYCYMTEVQVAELVVLHICGNWTPPVPVLKRYRIEFTKPELKENWQMLQRNMEAA